MKKLPKTVCALLNNHTAEFYPFLDKVQLKACTDVIEKLLASSEAKEIKKEDAERCVMTLRKSEHNCSKYLSTIGTWLVAIKC